jgi:DNA-binding transcriptional MocR family regulator
MALPMIKPAPLYEQLSTEITLQIQRGVFRPGDRLPSVRHLSQQRGISITTILQAYQLLEDQGTIEARPQSGYYVRAQSGPLPVESATERAKLRGPEQVQVGDLIMRMMHDANDTSLVQFGVSLPAADLLPTSRLNAILARFARGNRVPLNLYGTAEGCLELRNMIAKRAILSGCQFTSEDIVITSGCMEAISLALRTICQPGDLVAIESPTYFGTLQCIENQGLRALEIPTHAQDGMSLDALSFAIENHPVKAVLAITNFNNPLGSCIPDENKRALVDLLARHEIPLIEDDIHGELYAGSLRPTVAKAYDEDGLVLLCSSFSKDISPGYRVGWIAPGRFRKRLVQAKFSTNVSSPLLQQMAIAEFLETGGYDHHLRKLRRAYAQKVAYMSHAVMQHFPEGTRVSAPSGGYVLWVQLPEEVDSLLLYQQALKNGITIAPGYVFSSRPRYRNFVRLNAAYMSFSTERAIVKLGELVREEMRSKNVLK